ncbi:MAG: acyl-CoA dehydrogenase family protein [Pseudomonadota bacterium]
MDRPLTEEQSMLADSVARFVEQEYSFNDRQAIVRSAEGYRKANWQTFAELGWLGALMPEADGGFGGGPTECTLLMEGFGRGLVVEPFLATVVLCGGIVGHSRSREHQEMLLPKIASGTAQGAVAFVEPQARFNANNVETSAVKTGNGYVLNGFKSVVLNGPAADFLVVSARTAGESRDASGVSLFVIDANAEGVSRRNYPTVDGHRASEITLTDVKVGSNALLGEENEGTALLVRVLDEATLAVGAEAVGCMEVLYKDTVEYCKNRKQFGQPLSKFQALQHRMVDMYIEYEKSTSMMYAATTRMSAGYDVAAQEAVSAFKVQVGRSGRFIGQNAVQLHGGMGMTDELNIGHYFKRLTAIDTMFGNVDFHLQRFRALSTQAL